MASPTPTVVVENGSTTDANSYSVTASGGGNLSLSANKLYLLTATNGLAGTPDTPTVTGCGMTWVQVNTATRNNCRVTVFRALKTSAPSAGTLTIAFGGVTQSSCQWHLTEWTGIDTSGSNGSGTVVQNGANTGYTFGDDTMTASLPAAPGSNSSTYAALCLNHFSLVITPGTGYTSITTDTEPAGTPSIQRFVEWKAVASQTATADIPGTTKVNWGMVACEVKGSTSSQSVDLTGYSIPTGQAFGTATIGFAGGTGPVLPIALRSSSQSAINNSSVLNIPAPTSPSRVQVGDFMLAAIVLPADKDITSVPDQWNVHKNVVTVNATNTGTRLRTFWKKAQSADTTANQYAWGLTGSATDAAGGIVAYYNVNSDNPFDASGGKVTINEDTAASTISAPSDTTVAANDLLVTIHGMNPAVAGVTGWDIIGQANGVARASDGQTITESSGAASSTSGGGGVWVIRDSGNPNALYWMTPQSVRGKWNWRSITVTGATNSDWEDVVFYSGNLYIHDNRSTADGTYRAHRLYKCPEPSNPNSDTSVALTTTYYWDFPDDTISMTDVQGGRDPNTGVDVQHVHNCEAIEILNGEFIAVLKQHHNGTAGVYTFGPVGSLSTDINNPTRGTKVGVISHTSPSAFSISTDGKYVVTVSHEFIRIWQKGSGTDVTAYCDGNNTLVFEDSAHADNHEGADFYPYNTYDVAVFEESTNAYDLDATSFVFTPPAGMSERVDVVTPSITGSTVRAALEINDLAASGAGVASGTKTATFNQTGSNIGISYLLVQSTQSSGFIGPVINVSFDGVEVPDDQPTTPPSGPTTGLTGCMIGLYPDNNSNAAAVDAEIDILGNKEFALARVYQQWRTDISKVITDYIADGRMPVVSYKGPYAGTAQQTGSWNDLRAGGPRQSDIEKLADAYGRLDKECIVILHHEPHDNCRTTKPSCVNKLKNGLPDSGAGDYGTAAHYIAAYQNFANIFNQRAPKVKIGYCAVASWFEDEMYQRHNASDHVITTPLYAGNAYIDVFCHDEYNWYHAQIFKNGYGGGVTGQRKTAWQEWEDIWTDTLRKCDQEQIPLVIGEIGSDYSKPATGQPGPSITTDEQGKARSRGDWFTKGAQWIKTNALAQKWLIGFIYFHSAPADIDWQFTRGPHADDGVDGWIHGFVRDANGVTQDYFLSSPRAIAPNGVVAPPAPIGGGTGGTHKVGGYGIPSGESFGRATITFAGPIAIDFTGYSIPSEEFISEFFTVAVVGGPIPVKPYAIGSEEFFGTPTVYQADEKIVRVPRIQSFEFARDAILSAASNITRALVFYEQDAATVWNPDWLGVDLPPWIPSQRIIEGEVTISADRTERRSFDLVLDNSDLALIPFPKNSDYALPEGGLWYDKVVKLWRGVDYGWNSPENPAIHEMPPHLWGCGYPFLLGTFMIDRIEMGHFPHTIHIVGRDFTKKLLNSKFKNTTAFKPGYLVMDVIRGIALEGGIPATDILTEASTKKLLQGTGNTGTSQNSNDDIQFERGTARWDAIQQIATLYGYEAFFDANGILRVQTMPDPATTAEVLEFTVGTEFGPLGNLVSYNRSTSDSRLKNVLVVQGGKAGDATVPYAVVQNNLPHSSTNTDELGERVEIITNGLISSKDQAINLGLKLLPVYALEEYNMDFESIVFPFLDVNNIIRFINPDIATVLNIDHSSEPQHFLLRQVRIPLGLQAMSSVARRVVKVSDSNYPNFTW